MNISFRKFDRSSCSIPELSDGFDPTLAACAPGMNPVSFVSEEVPFGIYAVSVVLEALEDVERLYLFTGRKQLREILSLKRGQRLAGIYYLSAAEIIPRYHDSVYPVKQLSVTYCTEHPETIRVCRCSAEPADGAARIFLCGDSTVTDHSSEIPYHPGACYAAWGQVLPAFLTGPAAVENQAHCGLTMESFRSEGHFELVKRHIRNGDLCLFQFAHNDQKLPHLMANQGYTDNLRRFLDEIRECKASPVLVTPLGRNIWDADGCYLDLLVEYAGAVRKLAEETKTPCIDLHAYSTELMKKQGMKRSRDYFHPDDYTHTNEYGAYRFAAFLSKQLVRLFPDIVHCSKEEKQFLFIPPENIWDSLGGTDDRKAAPGQKEQFDRMEKSTSSLLKTIQKAKEEAMHQNQSAKQ